ncbi:DUF2905 domain-containing protein [Chlorobium sp. N1]|uniref:DUF2905 domain-containing protein n=1 Tax=Chlorobium sp. N1 TaxID=2491138 RepID=UPI00103AFDFB|nr:DUF2905 domain-containing protein [Chlorobium sp. N1]TCD47322.1 DUF2905 domain-containing protein [Chlorobium sp. N1]
MQVVFADAGKFLLIAGMAAVICGLFLLFLSRTGHTDLLAWIGHLPLDMKLERENFSLYFPLGTSILLSILLSLVAYLINRFIH